jgi:hypothetical protein
MATIVLSSAKIQRDGRGYQKKTAAELEDMVYVLERQLRKGHAFYRLKENDLTLFTNQIVIRATRQG